MIKYKYREKTYAEELLKSGFTSNFISYELKILVKYYKELGKKPKEREELIREFCQKYLTGYDRVIHFRLINSVLNYSAKKDVKLIEIDSVDVSKSELKYIDELNLDYDHKKILFTLLVLDKLNKKEYEIKHNKKPNDEYFFGGKESYYKDLKKRANVPTYRSKKKKNINDIIYDLNKEGLTESVSRAVIKLLFLYNIPQSNDIGLTITNYDYIGLYYDLHVGLDGMKKCECCGVPIKARSNRMKYCDDCWKEKELELKRNWKRKHDKNKKVEV